MVRLSAFDRQEFSKRTKSFGRTFSRYTVSCRRLITSKTWLVLSEINWDCLFAYYSIFRSVCKRNREEKRSFVAAYLMFHISYVAVLFLLRRANWNAFLSASMFLTLFLKSRFRKLNVKVCRWTTTLEINFNCLWFNSLLEEKKTFTTQCEFT